MDTAFHYCPNSPLGKIDKKSGTLSEQNTYFYKIIIFFACIHGVFTKQQSLFGQSNKVPVYSSLFKKNVLNIFKLLETGL